MAKEIGIFQLSIPIQEGNTSSMMKLIDALESGWEIVDKSVVKDCIVYILEREKRDI